MPGAPWTFRVADVAYFSELPRERSEATAGSDVGQPRLLCQPSHPLSGTGLPGVEF